MFQKKGRCSSDGETQRFFSGHDCFDPAQHVGKRSGVHYFGGRVANFLHYNSDSAAAFVAAFPASRVRGLTHAGKRSDRAVQYADYVSDAYQARFAVEEISAALAFSALQNSLVLEFEQD